MTSLVYVHGTNGSGKSTLARALLEAAGGLTSVKNLPEEKRATWTRTRKKDFVLVGRYTNPAGGGIDGITPYSSVMDILHWNSYYERNVFCEGIVTPGLETCQKFSSMFDDSTFILLTTDVDTCIRHVLDRRKVAGNDKEFNPKNLLLKSKSVVSWANRLEGSGLNVKRFTYDQALRFTLRKFDLS